MTDDSQLVHLLKGLALLGLFLAASHAVPIPVTGAGPWAAPQAVLAEYLFASGLQILLLAVLAWSALELYRAAGVHPWITRRWDG